MSANLRAHPILRSTAVHGLALWAVLVGACALVACEGVSQRAEEERRIAAEQLVIQAYAARVPEVDAKLAAFLATWERANEQRDVKSLKDDMRANVQPAFDAHIAALEAMPTGSEALRLIHEPLVAAYRSARSAFDVFLRDVTEDKLDAEYARLLAAMDGVRVAEEVYLEALGRHFTAHRMTLKSRP